MLRKLLTLATVALLVISAGCRKPGTSKSTSAAAYDPKTDPLVNPPSLLEPPPEDVSKIATDETLYLTLRGNPNTFNPIFVSTVFDFIVVDVLYTGLYTFGSDLKWRVNDEIVESFEESEDHTEFIVKIKPGFTWHDGHPWTAHDIVYAWKEILDPRVPCPAQKPGTDKIIECVALDDYTIKYVQPEPLATRHWNLVFPALPKHIFEKDKENHPDLKTGDYYSHLSRNPVGSGPYRLVEFKENSKIVVERWEDYKGKKPYFKRIVFRIIPDDNMALLAFEKEEVDVVEPLDAKKFALETNTDTFKQVGYKAWGVEWTEFHIVWNMDGTNPFFADRKVRYAMTHALNIPLVLDKVLYNLATPCYGTYHPDSWMYNPDIKLLEYDIDKAKNFLDEASWLVDSQDGWRYKVADGKKVPFEFTVLMAQGNPYYPKIAAIYQEDLKRIGIRIKTRSMEFSSYVEKVRKHEFQAVLAGWGTGTDPDTGWNIWRTEEYEKGRNYGAYSNSRVDELFEQGRKAFDPDKRRKVYQEIQKLVYEDQPYTWMYYRPTLAIFNKRIRGVQFSPRGIFNFDPSFYDWWIPAGYAAAHAH